QFPRPRLIKIALGAREDADVRSAQYRRVIDPPFRERDLLVALLAIGQREVVSDRSAADFNTAQERVALELHQVIPFDRVGEIIAGQLGSLAAMVRAEVDEIEERDALAGIFVVEILTK